MLIRTRLKLECARCGEPKLISVTIIDDAVGPAICDECVVQAMIARRNTGSPTPPPVPEPAHDTEPSPEAARGEAPARPSANASKAA